MKKVKVRIYKDQYGKGGFINPTKKFLQKAAYGMQVGQNTAAIEDIIIEELRKKTSNEDIADLLETEYNIPYYQALDAVDDIVDYVYDDYANEYGDAYANDMTMRMAMNMPTIVPMSMNMVMPTHMMGSLLQCAMLCVL
jgi:hypothetical protein